jgi:hypothetical protein
VIDEASLDVILKSFDEPDEVTHFSKGKFETVTLGGMTIGRATYEPGWKWSADVGPGVGEDFCTVEHVGMVVSGVATAAFADGRVTELTPGKLFYVPAEPHDSWVVGDEPYVSLHFLGATKYAQMEKAKT